MSFLVGAIRQTEALFNAEGTATALATVATLATLSLVLPRFTTSRSGPEFSPEQLVFAAISSIVLVFVQTIRHRDYFLPVEGDNTDPDSHAGPPSNRETFLSLSLLVVALVAVVGLAKTGSPAIQAALRAIGAPLSAAGVMIALLVLLPATLAAVRNARRDRIPDQPQPRLGFCHGQHWAHNPGSRRCDPMA